MSLKTPQPEARVTACDSCRIKLTFPHPWTGPAAGWNTACKSAG